MIDADYSQIELRVLAALSGDETLIHAFADDVDIHRLTASQVFQPFWGTARAQAPASGALRPGGHGERGGKGEI